MLALYILPTERFAGGNVDTATPLMTTREDECEREEEQDIAESQTTERAEDPVAFLYYSIVLTSLTVMVALVIGTIQLLTLILNVASPSGRFWDGVQTAGDHYEVIGGAICGSFVVFGGFAVLGYKPWRRHIERAKKERHQVLDAQSGSEASKLDRREDTIHGRKDVVSHGVV
jgi:nickel/cobalt transporter (NiCoT) family protein